MNTTLDPARTDTTGPIPVVHAAIAPPDFEVSSADDPAQLLLRRTFGFLDLSGFTAYTERHGAAGATAVLRAFRDTVREVCSRRGVRVAKWLGDGVMIVGVDSAPVVCTVAELVARMQGTELSVRAGLATGRVMLFEGDDYIGPVVNLASRLCDAAGDGRILSDHDSVQRLPDWIDASKTQTIRVRGLGQVPMVHSLTLA